MLWGYIQKGKNELIYWVYTWNIMDLQLHMKETMLGLWHQRHLWE